MENARQGILVVSSCPGGSTTFGWQIDRYPTPRREGAVKIVAADGLRLTLQAETGATFVFDVAERKYVAASAPAPAPTTPRPTATLVPPPAPATAEPASGAADEEGPRMCTAAALGAVYEGRIAPHDGWLAGHVLFTNRAAAACILYGWPRQMDLVDARGGALPVEQGPNGDRGPDSGFLLESGRSARVEVWWSNWCQTAPEGPLSLAVSPSEGGGQLAVPVEGNVPPCTHPTHPSWLHVGPFQRWE